jgi:hypothetical protein
MSRSSAIRKCLVFSALAVALPLACATSADRSSLEASANDERPKGRPPGWEAAARAARLNGETVAGRGFARDLYNAYGRTRPDVLLSCSIRIPDERSTRILFRFDAEGGVVETLAYPGSDYADCLIEGLREVAHPPPPKPDYWFTVVDPSWRDIGPELPPS